MKYTVAAVTVTLAATASALTCSNLTVPVSISARNGVFNQQALTPTTNIDVTDFVLDLTEQGKNFTAAQLLGYATVSGTYHLAATYCQPDGGAPDVVQLLTHGIGFDRTYWNPAFNNYNYSYVKEAVDEYGYATFAWDRLGVGQSSHGEPVNEIQAYLEVAALKALTDDLRAGSIEGVPKFPKVVHVGHSYGSQHTYLLTAMYPGVSDGIALTGFSLNGSFFPYFALGANLVQANSNPALASYVDGYIANYGTVGVQIDFFAPGTFDPQILQFAFDIGQPVTVGELLSSSGETNVPNTFPGPVFIITGERDIPFCGGNCLAPPTGFTSIPAAAKKSFTNTSVFDVSIVPGAGHGLNFEYSHPDTFAQVNNFFAQNGAAAQAASGSTSNPSTTTSLAGGATQTWGGPPTWGGIPTWGAWNGPHVSKAWRA